MAASLRSTRPVAKAVLPNRMGRLDHRLCGAHSNGKRERRHALSVSRLPPRRARRFRSRRAEMWRKMGLTKDRGAPGEASLRLAEMNQYSVTHVPGDEAVEPG